MCLEHNENVSTTKPLLRAHPNCVQCSAPADPPPYTSINAHMHAAAQVHNYSFNMLFTSTRMCIHIRTYGCPYGRGWVRLYVCGETCVRTCLVACTHACVRVYMCVCVDVCQYVCVHGGACARVQRVNCHWGGRKKKSMENLPPKQAPGGKKISPVHHSKAFQLGIMLQ